MRRAALVCAAVALGGCGGKDAARPPAPTPEPPAAERTPEAAEAGPLDLDLAVGITEPNPNFVWPDAERDVPAPFARWRDELHEMRPALYRLVVDWAGVSSPDGRELDLGKPNGGCMRQVGPCAGYAGVREQLQALGAAQRASDGKAWHVLVVISGTPEGLADRREGCFDKERSARSFPPVDDGVAVYGKLITRLLDLARETKTELRYWSPWNEANHPFGFSPQRRRCSADARSTALRPYAALAREMKRTLDEAEGEQELVLGELAGLLQKKPKYTRVQEFIRDLPRDVVCSARIWSQHGYIGGPDPVDEVADALATHRCEHEHAIWITETGAGAARRGEKRRASGRAQRRACRNISERLERWREDPRVSAAVQYTLREDDIFPTGLVTTDLDEAYPALKAWQAWGRRAPGASAPEPGATCAARS